MRKHLLFIPLAAMIFALSAAPAAMAIVPTLSADGLLKKMSVTIQVWDASAGKWVKQKVSVAEDKSVTTNSNYIDLLYYTSAVEGDTVYVNGGMLFSNGKGWFHFVGELPLNGSRATGNLEVTGEIVVDDDGNIQLDTNGHPFPGSGNGHTVRFFGGARKSIIVSKEDSGIKKGTIKIAPVPFEAWYNDVTAGSETFLFPTSAKVKIGPIKFETVVP